jgi:hypothetical protein
MIMFLVCLARFDQRLLYMYDSVKVNIGRERCWLILVEDKLPDDIDLKKGV